MAAILDTFYPGKLKRHRTALPLPLNFNFRPAFTQMFPIYTYIVKALILILGVITWIANLDISDLVVISAMLTYIIIDI